MFWHIMTLASLMGLTFLAAYWYANKVGEAAYRQGKEAGRRDASRRGPPEPVADPYGVELGRIRTVESMREAAAYTCRLVAREAANKARLANEAASDQRLSQETRDQATARQKAWLYTCEAAERCEREIRALGLRPPSSPVVMDEE